MNHPPNEPDSPFLLGVGLALGMGMILLLLPTLMYQPMKDGTHQAIPQWLGAWNRTQQTYFLEKGHFASRQEMAAVLPKDFPPSPYQAHFIQTAGAIAVQVVPQKDGYFSYWAAVFQVPTETTTRAILCESHRPSLQAMDRPFLQTKGKVIVPQCGRGSRPFRPQQFWW